MYLPDSIFEILASIGIGADENAGEFWFIHREKVAIEINKRFSPTDFQRFENQIRWMTPIGIDAQRAVREFIEAQHKLLDEATVMEPRRTFILDFSGFSFRSGGKQYTIAEFQERYTNSKVCPHVNLSGIDLRGIKINRCTVRYVVLTYANLDESQIGDVIFENSSLNFSSLRGARLRQVRFNQNGISGADISGAFFNAVTLDDTSVPDKLIFQEVSYLYLLLVLLKSWFSRNGFSETGLIGKRKHTVFLFNDTSGLSGLRNSAVKNYIQWYEYVFNKFRDFKTLPIGEKIMFSISVIFSKVWTSLTVLAMQALLMNVVFATYYYANNSLIKNLDYTFLSAFYFSIVTFVTLGYGDMSPEPGCGQVAVIIEVIIGYITLGSFAFLTGHKVSGRY